MTSKPPERTATSSSNPSPLLPDLKTIIATVAIQLLNLAIHHLIALLTKHNVTAEPPTPQEKDT